MSGPPCPKAKSKKKVRAPKSWKAEADRLFSQLIRARGYCERCGKGSGRQLQTSHIYSRKYSATRCDPINALCLCAPCHHWWHERPVDAVSWLHESVYDVQTLRDLRDRAHSGVKVNWQEVVLGLREQLKAVA